jgi:hypothetical protein
VPPVHRTVRGRLVVHAHCYQPFRADPFSGRVPPDPSAAPFADWNARITAECYRPNVERGNYARISFDLGPTLAAWLATEAPEVLAGFIAADHEGLLRSAIAQAYHHSILPLAPMHDRRTEIAWGLREFELRFGRRPTALWLPETAVDLPTLRILAAAGVEATILAPWQADVPAVDTRTPYRVELGGGRSIVVAFYEGELSGALSFEPSVTADADRFARERVAPRLATPLGGGDSPMVLLATDGELYGHHQAFRDLFLQRLVQPDKSVADRGFDIVDLESVLAEPSGRVHPPIRIRERTSWSCHHGVLRWFAECPDVPDARWKGPLRGALDRLAGAIDTLTDALADGLPGLESIWTARDGYVDVVVGAVEGEEFAASCLAPSATAADRALFLDLLEAQRWRLAMFASDGWYWDDPARPETKQVLRAAARAVRLAEGAGGRDSDGRIESRLVADLALFSSPSLGHTGAVLYRQALAEIGQPPPRI